METLGILNLCIATFPPLPPSTPSLSLSPLHPPSLIADETDIIDEAIYYFKANVFFKQYEVKVSEEGPSLPLVLHLAGLWPCLHVSPLEPTLTRVHMYIHMYINTYASTCCACVFSHFVCMCNLCLFSLSEECAMFSQGPADRVLIYLTLYISECLKKLQKVYT